MMKSPRGTYPAPSRRRPTHGRRSQGFTLVELMVALALGAIISVIVSFISTTARKSYTQTVASVDIYSRFRLAFNNLQRDMSRWIRSQELEFYTDGRGGRPRDFHWQPGEELADRSDANGPGVYDGGLGGEYDEFAFVEQRQYKSLEYDQIENYADSEAKLHDAYRLYFRTMTFVDGAVREANVEYFLTNVPVDAWNVEGKPWAPPVPMNIEKPGQPLGPQQVSDLTLYKVVRFLEINEDVLLNINQNPPVKRVILQLATNITDFRVEYMVSNPYNKGERGGFRTPETDFTDPAEPVTRPVRLAGPSGTQIYRKTFGYGSMDLEKVYPRATAYSAAWGDNRLRGLQGHFPVRFGFRSNPQIMFAELTAGDSLYIFTNATVGSTQQSGGSAGQLVRFPAGDYTVKANLNGMLEFFEDVDASTWGEQDQRPVNYKAAYIPSAVRLTLRMVDDEGRNPKTMQQVVQLRRRSRL